MPKYYCDYCDVYLTHDSASVRKTHNTGYVFYFPLLLQTLTENRWKHKMAVRQFYQQFAEDWTQALIDSKVREMEANRFGMYFSNTTASLLHRIIFSSCSLIIHSLHMYSFTSILVSAVPALLLHTLTSSHSSRRNTCFFPPIPHRRSYRNASSTLPHARHDAWNAWWSHGYARHATTSRRSSHGPHAKPRHDTWNARRSHGDARNAWGSNGFDGPDGPDGSYGSDGSNGSYARYASWHVWSSS